MREDGRGAPGLLATAGGVIRWRARSHAKIWILAASGYLAMGIAFVLIKGWHQAGAFTLVAAAGPWIGGGRVRNLVVRFMTLREDVAGGMGGTRAVG